MSVIAIVTVVADIRQLKGRLGLITEHYFRFLPIYHFGRSRPNSSWHSGPGAPSELAAVHEPFSSHRIAVAQGIAVAEVRVSNLPSVLDTVVLALQRPNWPARDNPRWSHTYYP